MTTTYVAQREASKRLANGHVLKARVHLVHLEGNARPYFSATAVEIDPRRRNNADGGEVAGGCLHDEIVRAFPHFAPVVLVHLADDRGEPMHAEANALYWMGATKWETYDRTKLANHLRCTPAEADEIESYVRGDDYNSEALRFMLKALHLRERWAAEAAAALAVINATD